MAKYNLKNDENYQLFLQSYSDVFEHRPIPDIPQHDLLMLVEIWMVCDLQILKRKNYILIHYLRYILKHIWFWFDVLPRNK